MALDVMNQKLFFVPNDEWHRKIRRRLELLEGHRLSTREQVLDAFFHNLGVFQPDARKRIEVGLRIYAEPPSGRCLTCDAKLPDRSQYYCSTLCEQNSHLIVRPDLARKHGGLRGARVERRR